MWCAWSIWTSKTRWDRIIYAPEIHQELSSKHLIHDTMQTWICKLLCPYTTSVTEEQPYSLAPELHLGWGHVWTKAVDFLAMERDYLLSLGFFSAKTFQLLVKNNHHYFTKGPLLFFNIHGCSFWAEPIGNSQRFQLDNNQQVDNDCPREWMILASGQIP